MLCPPVLFALKDKHNHITVMKLHLPHKFQAALMAALASVSFITLGTGTTAQAWTAQTSTSNEYVSTADSLTTYGWNYNAETGEITAPNNIWDSFTFKLNNTYLSGHSGNEKMLYVSTSTTWGFYATDTGITGLWQGNTWTNGGTIAQGTLSPLADGEGKIILTAKINTGGTYLYKGVGTADTNQIYGASNLKSTNTGSITKLTLSKNLVDSFLVSHTSATVTQNDGTVKNYAWAYEQASGRSGTMKTDTGYNAYIVRSGAEAWFASGTGTVNIAGDLYVAGTYNDGYGALRLGTDANGVLNMNGGLYLGADSVICSDSEGTAKRGTINFNGDVVGSDYTLTLAVKRNNGSDMVFNNTVNLGGLVSQSTLTFGSQAVATVGDVTFTTAGRTYANDGDLTINGTANLGTAFTNTGDLTLNGTATLGGVLTNTGTLTLNGTVALGSGLSIVNNTDGVVKLLNGVVFDLTNVQAETSGDTKTYTLFTGSQNVDLTSLNGDTVTDHFTGTTAAGHTWEFTSDGKLVSTVASRELMWVSYGPGTWTSQDDSQTPWAPKNEFSTTYFHNGDSVTFSYVTGDEQATLGSDVEALKMTLDTDTPDVTINNGGTYSLHVETLDIKSGHLTTNTEMTVQNVSIAAGAEWSLGGTLDVDTLASYTNSGTLHVLDGGRVNVHKGTATGNVTADAGGTLYVDNGSGQGDAGYTFHGMESDPFEGTLVYDILSSGNHNVSIALENFQGTLELRGRLAASASNFGGMTKLVLNGDRATNTTGMWINGSALTLDVPVDIVGENTVDLYTSTNLTLNGDINAGGAAGILGKRDGAALYLNGNVNLLGLNVYQNTVHLNGGAQKAYNLGAVTLNGGSLAVDAAGVGSLSAADLIVISTNTLSSATAEPTEFNVTRFDVSNHNTNFTLQNVELNVSGAATAAELNTAQNVDAATVTVGSAATLNLGGGVVWKKQDGAKTDYVNLTVNNGGTANVNAGEANILNDVTVNAGGKLNFASNTGTEIAGTLVLADTIDNSGNVTINSGSVAAGQAGALSGNGTYTIKGTVAAAGTLKLDGTTVTGAGTEQAPAALTGNVDIKGGTIGGTLNIGADGSTVSILEAFTVANGTTLRFDGHVVLDALEGTAEVFYAEGEQDTENNGFISGVSVKVYTPGENVDVTFPGGITYKGADVYDYTESGTFTSSSTSYDTFFVNTSGTTESLNHALTVAEGHGTVTTVQLADGTALAMDHADATLQHLVLKEGASATLNVTQSATISSVEGLGTAQALTVTGTAGKVLAISTTETVAGMLSVTGATLKLDTNLTLAGGLDNNGTINLEGRTLTLNGQEGGTTYNMGTITGNDSTNLYANANTNVVFTGNATMHHMESASGSTVTVAETATLTFTNVSNRQQTGNYNTFYGLDNQGTISIKSGNGDLRFWGTRNDQVFNVGHLHIDGTTGTSYMLTAGGVNYTTDIVVKNLSGGSASHTLQVSDCYNGGTQGQVIDFIIGEAQDHNNLYEGKIQYGIGTGSALAGSGMNLVIKDDLVASKAVLDAIFSGSNAQSATITVDTAHAKVKGLTGTSASARSMHVSGTKAEGSSDNRVLEIVGDGSNYNYNYGGTLGANLDVVHSGTGTQSFAGVDGFDGSIDVEGGVLNILKATSVNVRDVTINNAILGVYSNAMVAEANEGTLTIKNTKTLTAKGAGATLNANLVMDSGSTLDVSGTNGMGLAMGSTVTLNKGMELADYSEEWASWSVGTKYVLFTGVDGLNIGNDFQTSAIDYTQWVDAQQYFSNIGEVNRYFLCYTGADSMNGGVGQYTFNGSNVGMVYIMVMPEPTTGTLSLLALAALAARRRRK